MSDLLSKTSASSVHVQLFMRGLGVHVRRMEQNKVHAFGGRHAFGALRWGRGNSEEQ